MNIGAQNSSNFKSYAFRSTRIKCPMEASHGYLPFIVVVRIADKLDLVIMLFYRKGYRHIISTASKVD